MKKIISKKTEKIRHFLVKILAPTIYRRAMKDIDFVASIRPMIKAVKKRFRNKELIGVEIGVREGVNAEKILLWVNIKRLYLIDPYEPYMDFGDSEVPIDPTDTLPEAKELLARFKEKITFILKKSSEAVDDTPDKVDFVYIDGNHSYEFVKKDIELYYDKVKPGGIIGGHDFEMGRDVARAVTEFVEKKNLKLRRKEIDWWVIKPLKTLVNNRKINR